MIGLKSVKQTSISGILAAAMIIINQLQNYFDTDPLTVVDFNAIVAALSIAWLGIKAKQATD